MNTNDALAKAWDEGFWAGVADANDIISAGNPHSPNRIIGTAPDGYFIASVPREYAVCYRADNGNVIPVTTTTAYREGAIKELADYKTGEKEAGGDPDRLFLASRRIPKWTPEPVKA